jgi:hypothetical protein
MAPVLRIGYAVANVGHVGRHGGGDGGENEERSEMHGAAEIAGGAAVFAWSSLMRECR